MKSITITVSETTLDDIKIEVDGKPYVLKQEQKPTSRRPKIAQRQGKRAR